MPYTFQEIDMFAFDLHVTTKHLRSQQLLREEFQFLADSDLYSKRYAAGPFQTENFSFQPISSRARKREHFWNYYKGTSLNLNSSDFWSLQFPFACKPKNVQLTFSDPLWKFYVQVRPVIYLFPMGWSTNIEILVKGKIQPDQLINFVGTIQGMMRPFLLNGKAYELPYLFDSFSRMLKKEIFIDSFSAEDFRPIDKYLIVSLAQFTGPRQYYRARLQSDPKMPDDDRALMHSILWGQKIQLADLAKLESEKKRKFMLTWFRGADFAISYFNRGTLICMQEQAGDAKRRKSLGCFASNIRHFVMTSQALLEFRSALKDVALSEPSAGMLRDNIKIRLIDLGHRYKNALCKTWYMHGRLRHLNDRPAQQN